MAECEHNMNEADKIVVYEKTTCNTCKDLVMLLKEKGIDFEEIDYMIEPIPRDKLVSLLRKMGMSARELIRTNEPAYRDLGLDRPEVTDDDLLAALVAHPGLVQRPIVEIGERAILARPPERVNEIL